MYGYILGMLTNRLTIYSVCVNNNINNNNNKNNNNNNNIIIKEIEIYKTIILILGLKPAIPFSKYDQHCVHTINNECHDITIRVINLEFKLVITHVNGIMSFVCYR